MMDWLVANKENIVAIVVAVMVLARIIVGLTKTTKDDAVVAWIINALKSVLGIEVKK